jgi:Putative bacterial sensory transduction regulator
MRMLAALSFLMLMASQVAAGPFDGSDDYKTHLEFLGYTVTETDKALLAKHPQNFNVYVRTYQGGVLINSIFGTSPKGKKDRIGLLTFLNDMNRGSVAARYYVDKEDDVIIEGWYPGAYDKTRFSLFLDKYNLISQQMRKSPVAKQMLQ